ncbi:succinate dehydrogenase / fumarate reductase cytochrome b subunit [Arcticibacter tournemirensis]|uniref:Succinate dehydrogenase cytochrome b subunit n=1 Tax=Arcticibacter tournemirensis TaxID=699437 RepID=A0A5M9H465_9SPHI|nr:succinate dehydrogenase cytochrome b subunit [Arcticibacter tournemirensis]KAA8481400.1 succinate dehydrogenase cytochrome b subunit [Arcticibacter tournemirensis]TQM48983.1 succinate dehydrogenase / fumarate reductase cytochrome b subunit [Arcticibacter tournemirensis]
MSSFTKAFSSTLGKKLIMSLTGLFLCLFLIVHLLGNLQLFKHDDGMAFNVYSHFMTHFPPIKIVSYLLYLSIVFHAVYALVISIRNRRARKVGYAVYKGSANSSWSSRNMGILGTVLLIFIVVHMTNFWAEYHWGGLPFIKYETSLTNPEEVKVTKIPYDGHQMVHSEYVDLQSGNQVVIAKDLNIIVMELFKLWWYVALYVIAMIAMGYHLYHGFQSGFQTLGFDHKKYKPAIDFLGLWVFSIIIPAVFAAMPLYVFFFK